MKKFFAAFCLFAFLCESASFAGRLRFRAREHFDTMTIRYEESDREETPSGIGPVINFWWEEPYENSFGLALGLTLIDFEKSSEALGRGQNMELWERGVEGKHYLVHGEGGLYFRWGVSRNQLQTGGSLGELTGTGGYLGIGWELPFEILGLALEIGHRQTRLEDRVFMDIRSPSIGVHFYEHL